MQIPSHLSLTSKCLANSRKAFQYDTTITSGGSSRGCRGKGSSWFWQGVSPCALSGQTEYERQAKRQPHRTRQGLYVCFQLKGVF